MGKKKNIKFIKIWQLYLINVKITKQQNIFKTIKKIITQEKDVWT